MDDNLERLHQLAGKLTSTEYELAHANALLAAVVQGADEAIITKDKHNFITSWNPAAERLYGWSAEEAIGKHISILLPESKQTEFDTMMDHVYSGESVKLETSRKKKNGREFPIKITVSPIRSSNGEIVGASSIAHPANWQWDDLTNG